MPQILRAGRKVKQLVKIKIFNLGAQTANINWFAPFEFYWMFKKLRTEQITNAYIAGPSKCVYSRRFADCLIE